MRHKLDWFIKRIGKKVFRKQNKCGCAMCYEGWKDGILVHDKRQAIYICDCQNEMGLDYADRPFK